MYHVSNLMNIDVNDTLGPKKVEPIKMIKAYKEKAEFTGVTKEELNTDTTIKSHVCNGILYTIA